MKIVVYYESPEEQELAERIVPDVAALANFVTDAVSPCPCPVSAAPDYSFQPGKAYTIDDVNAMRHIGFGDVTRVPGPYSASVMPGGGGRGGHAGNAYSWGTISQQPVQPPNHCVRHGITYPGVSCPECLRAMVEAAI